MLRRGFCLATAAAAIAANALLIPQDFTRKPTDDRLGLLNADPKSRSIRLPCPACEFSLERAGLEDVSIESDVWQTLASAQNDVVLHFTISEDGGHLLLNDQPIYPHVFHGFHSSEASILVDPASISTDLLKPLEITDSSIRIDHAHQASDEGDVVVPIHYQILAFDARQMKDLPEVVVNLLKTVEGELFILGAVTSLRPPVDAPPPPPPPPSHHEHHRHHHHHHEHDRECDLWPSLVCKLKHLFEGDREHDRRPACDAHEAHYSHHPPTPFNDDADDEDERGFMPSPPPSPHHHLNHDLSHDRHDHPHFFHSILRGVVGALIPVLAGITVGLSVSFMALSVGRAVAWSFSRVRRGSSQRRCRRRRHRLSAIDLAEGKILTADDEADVPPAYENAPAYDELA